ncbi:MAG: hypothetical protein U5L98_05435 [Halomonas sp.]|uniref:hypothetical protein n=1 Tax=Halomonas sp. TaxID=1486246 RepID=UPI002ACE3377|nr:hypothetical protein [Halomonas sp.]MDZ7852097.1 hypothetical protein [Halomonas sp.]
MHLLHMGDHPHPAPKRLKAFQGFHGQRQGLRVEAAEAFVDEQRFDHQFSRGHGG